MRKDRVVYAYLMMALFSFLAAALPLSAQVEDYSYKLSQSTTSYQFWTAPTCQRIFKDDVVPTDTGSLVKVYAAKNEFEPFQVVVKPTSSGSVTVTVGSFGSGITFELFQVQYVNITQTSDYLGRLGDYPDPLWPLANGASVTLTAGENTAFWIVVNVPSTTAWGDYPSTIQIGGISIPINLHVFNFAIPSDLHVKSQMNVSINTILSYYSVSCCDTPYWNYVDNFKQFFIDHRLTPKGPLWSGGLTSNGGGPYIDYNCAGIWTDNDGIWGFEQPAERWLDGTGLMSGTYSQTFNGGTGFPSFMAATFQNNDASADQRPASFCGLTRTSSDWYTGNNPTSPYNQKWFQYITSMEDYLDSMGPGFLDKSYYYIANEPQDQDDYNAVAWYSQYLKIAAPDLKLMVSEEPRPEIYAHPTYAGAKIDIWLPVLNNYSPAVSHERELNHDEETWIYFLYGTRPPYFNPITLDHPGIESRYPGWFLWKYRIKGIAYYSMNNWSKNPWTDPLTDGHNGDLFMLYPPSKSNTPIPYGSNNHRFVPSIRFELMRDGFEDYEYFYLLNGSAQPAVGVVNAADAQVDKVISGVASYTRDCEFLSNLRRLIGLYLGGEISSIPDIQPPVTHPRSAGYPGSYYVNFQDPYGIPLTTYTEDSWGTGHIYRYVTYAGHDYLQAGTEQYDEAAGYGWLDDTTNFLAGRDPWGSETDERKITYVYDDWAHHPSIWEFDLPSGKYSITVSVGTPRSVRNHNRVVIEGVTFIDDEASSYYIVRTLPVTVTDSKLTVDIGIWDEYCMIDYLDIVPLDTDSDGMPDYFEYQHACLNAGSGDAGLDPDYDILTSLQEYKFGTDPCDGDSDSGGENDGSEKAGGRNPLIQSDDLAMTIGLTRAGSTVTLYWDDTYGDNSLISGYYFVYRSTAPTIMSGDLTYGPLPDGTNFQADDASDCEPCFYTVRNTLVE